MSSLDDKVSQCETLLEYTFTNRDLCAEALNMSGEYTPWKGHHQKLRPNKALAIYGDFVFSAKLCRQWYEANLSRDEWTTIRSTAASNANANAVGVKLGLEPCINMNPGMKQASAAMMATTLVALLGAVYIDGGDKALTAVMDRLDLTHDLLKPTEPDKTASG